MTEPVVAPTVPSSPAPAAPSPSPAAPAVTAAVSPASTPTPTTSTPTAPSRPADLPEAFWDTEKGAVNTAKINEMIVARAADESRRLSLPQKPEDVSLDLPEDFKPPDGIDFKWDPNKPGYNEIRELVVADGIPQATATKLAALFAKIMVGDQASMRAWEAAEVAKLGANGTARATQVEIGMKGLVGEELAAHAKAMTRTAGGIQFLEAVLAKVVSQGVAKFSQAHREPGQA